MPAYTEQSCYCDSCNIAYSGTNSHKCPNLCSTCQNKSCNVSETLSLKCNKCSMQARDEICTQRHYEFLCSKKVNC